MAISIIEKIYVVDMTNVETDDVTTLSNAYVSLDAAYDAIEECKRIDERADQTEWWTYRVREFTLFR